MKKIVLIVAMAMVAVMANAIPAKPGMHRIVLADGSEVQAQLVGDEFHHCFVTSEGKLLKLRTDGQYELSDEKFDNAKMTLMRAEGKQRRMVMDPKSVAATNYASKGLAILVGFSNKPFSNTASDFSNLLNQEGYSYNGATGSVKDYFSASSYGQYNPTFDVYGPYTLAHPMSYYGGNDSYGDDKRPDQMVADAVAALVAEQGSAILADYDCDNDGYVDNVFVFYAGYAESSGGGSDCIWPHRWIVSSWYVDGPVSYSTPSGTKTIYDYACSSEFDGNSGSSRTGVGAFCHEFSHVLGLPDLYDVNYTYQFTTPSEWDLMDAGCYNNDEKTPPVWSAYERFYVGWLTPELLNEPGHYTLQGVNNGEGQAYIITQTGYHNLNGQNPNPKEFYILENRQKTGWDRYLPGHGMLIWKIKYNASNWANNSVNNSKSNQGVDIMEAGGSKSYTSGSDPFPGTSKVDSYTPYADYKLVNIKEASGIISFDIPVASGSDVISAEDGGALLFRGAGNLRCLMNVPEGAIVTCFDGTGKELWKKNDNAGMVEFETNGEFFVLKIEAENGVQIVKGI